MSVCCLPVRNRATFYFWDNVISNFYTVEVIFVKREEKKLITLKRNFSAKCAIKVGIFFALCFVKRKKTWCFSTSLAFCFQLQSLNSVLLSWFILAFARETSIWTPLRDEKCQDLCSRNGVVHSFVLFNSLPISEVSWGICLGWPRKSVGAGGMVPSHQNRLLVARECSPLCLSSVGSDGFLPLLSSSGVTLILCTSGLKTWVLFWLHAFFL